VYVLDYPCFSSPHPPLPRIIESRLCYDVIFNLICAFITLSTVAAVRFCVPFPPPGARAPSGARVSYYRGFTITLSLTTLGRTPLNELSSRRRDLYLTAHNTHKRQTSMPPAGFEPAIRASERPQTHASDRAAIGIGLHSIGPRKK
jgi:hypothetical protein